jgi:hypothetical protein
MYFYEPPDFRLPGTIGRTAHDWQRSHQTTRLLYEPPISTTQTRRVIDGGVGYFSDNE